MSVPPLMSERPEPNAPSLRDCEYAGYMMALWKSGYRGWPKGWTTAEREALERADDRPNETGASVVNVDQGAQRRYGRHLEPASRATLEAQLKSKSSPYGFNLGGLNARFPSYLRIGGFTGNHAGYAESARDGIHARWLDPLRPWGYRGDLVDIGIILHWHDALPGEIRIAKEAALYTLRVVKFAAPRTWTVTKGTTLDGWDPRYPGHPVQSATWSATSSAHADAQVWVTWPGDSTPPVPHGGPFLRVIDGFYKGHLIVQSKVTLR